MELQSPGHNVDDCLEGPRMLFQQRCRLRTLALAPIGCIKTQEPSPSSLVSSCLQFFQSGQRKLPQRRKLCPEYSTPPNRQSIGLAAIFGLKCFDEALLVKPRAAHLEDVLDHRVAVLRPVGQAGKHEERRVGVVAEVRRGCFSCYDPHVSHCVIIAS
jgi:hypothetical protein